MDWLASVSPGNANITRYQDDQYLFEEVQIISAQTTGSDFERNHPKIAELVQKYIPYPVLLCIYHDNNFVLNTCDKKINQNDSSKRTIEKRYITEIINLAEPTEQQQEFLSSLCFAELDKTNLKTYYDAYSQRIIALQSASFSGLFIPRTQSRTQSDMDRLEKIEVLNKEILILQNQAQKETQLNRRVALNTQIQEKRKQVETLKEFIKL